MRKANPIPAPAPIPLTPFDLSRVLAGAPLITRDGQPAKLECHKPGASYPVRCIVSGKSHSFRATGTYWVNKPDPMDLFMTAEVSEHLLVQQFPEVRK